MTWMNPQKWAAETVRERIERVRSRVAKESILRKMRELYGPNWDAVRLPWESMRMRIHVKRKVSVRGFYSNSMFYSEGHCNLAGEGTIALRQEATCPKEKTMTQLILEFDQVYISAGYHDVK